MFKRNVVLAALLAVVLLGALMDGSASADRSLKRRRRAAMERPCASCVVQSLSNFVNSVAGVRPTIDPTRLQALREVKHRRPRAAMEPAGLQQIAGGARTPDPTGTTRA